MQLSEGIGGRYPRPSQQAVRRAVEVVLVVALAAQGARLFWAAVTPLEPLGEPVAAQARRPFAAPPDLSALESFAPATAAAPLFGQTAAVAVAAPAISGYRLHGVRGSMFGDGGSAIIAGPDGSQSSYRRGDAVGPGVTLAAIGRDAVTLAGAGGSVRLEIGADPTPAAPPAQPAAPSPGFMLPAPPPTAGAPPAGDPAQLMSQLDLSPRQTGGGVSGYAVGPRGGALARQAGLQPGDVLLSVNGQPLDPARADALAAGLAGAGEAELRFQRGGRTLTTRIQAGAR